jgi:hypothetical protein
LGCGKKWWCWHHEDEAEAETEPRPTKHFTVKRTQMKNIRWNNMDMVGVAENLEKVKREVPNIYIHSET